MQKRGYEQLTESQREAVFHFEGPLLVLAGPGSGKTRVITYRIAALIDSGVRPYNICAITFTNKAANEMRERAMALGASGGAHISTFHSLCVRILRQYAERAGIGRNFSIYDAADQSRCIKEAVKDCELDASDFPPGKMLNIISGLKNDMMDLERFKNIADNSFSRTLAKVYARYQKILAEHNALDFDDLLMKTAALLEKRADVRDELGDRYKFLLVDEYQDTNQAQYQIARLLVSNHNNICVTGDPDQSIYRWRGADIRNILDFEKNWPEAKVVKLEENFRSTPGILEVADRLIAHNRKRKEKRLVATRPGGGDIRAEGYEDEHVEAAEVVRRIKEMLDKGVSGREIAVFYRVNAMSRVFEESLVKNKVPYQIVRGVEFYNRKEIRDVLAYLKILVNPQDEVALVRIINTPARGIGKTTVDRVKAWAEANGISLYEGLSKAGRIDSLGAGPKAKIAAFVGMVERFKSETAGKVGPLVERIFAESGLKGALEGSKEMETELENVNELINAAHDYDKGTEEPSLVDYLQQISLFSDVDVYDEKCERVALMTLHAAKGLEFDNVFIAGVEDGLLPHERVADDEDEMEEERRLLFVGITRARMNLHLSYARYRTLRGQMMRTIPSEFLFELGLELHECESCFEEDEDEDWEEEEYEEDDEEVERFKVNDLVRHKKFGLGRVTKFLDMGADSIVVVRFNNGQSKTLLLKYANLVRA